MQPRTELAVGAVVLVLLGAGAAALGSRNARTGDDDPRRSTYLYGPSGASAFLGALARLGVQVEPYRRPLAALKAAEVSAPRTLFAFLGPAESLTPAEGAHLTALPNDLLLAGATTAGAMRCLGYDVVPLRGNAIIAQPFMGDGSRTIPSVRWILRPRSGSTFVDSSDVVDGLPVSCSAPTPVGIDTLLQSAGRPVAIRLALSGGRTVSLVSDDRLFSNRLLRESGAGPFVLGLVVPRYRHVVIDEYHHGFGISRSLAGATLAWSLHSPWGWAMWQLAAIGLIALLASGYRLGAARHVIGRRRRSPLEHVRALATALAAARGQDVAVRLIVQGLRRRLAGTGRPAPAGSTTWLASLEPTLRTERGRDALAHLVALTATGADADGVLAAANDVETIWEELKPS